MLTFTKINIRLSTYSKKIDERISLDALEVYSNQQRVNSTLTTLLEPAQFVASNQAVAIGKLINQGVYTNITTFLYGSIYTAKFAMQTAPQVKVTDIVYARIKGYDQARFPESIVVSGTLTYGGATAEVLLYKKEKLIHNADGTLNAAPALANAANIPDWSATLKSSNIDLAANKKAVAFKAGIANNLRCKALTETSISTGKWYFEVLASTKDTSAILGFASDNYTEASNDTKMLGQDTQGQSIGLIPGMGVVYKGTAAEGEKLKKEGFKHLPANVTNVYLQNGALIYPTGVYLDLDNRFIAFIAYNKNVTLVLDIPWSGAVRLAVGKGTYDKPQVLPFFNWGMYPFECVSGLKALGHNTQYTPGFGKETVSDWNSYFGYKQMAKYQDPSKLLPLVKSTEYIAQAPVDSLDASLPVEASLANQRLGWGYIKSKVTKGPQLVPISTIVQLIDVEYMEVYATVWSDGKTGEFEFKYIPESRLYNVVALDPDLGWVSAINGPIKPSRLPGSEGRDLPEIYP